MRGVVCMSLQSAMIYNTAIAIKDGLPVLFLSVCNMLGESTCIAFTSRAV